MRTRVGYAGGIKENPTYHNLGDYTETLQIDYDPNIISYKDLCHLYWETHNSCYNSYSRQYMSIVFYHDDGQKEIVDKMKNQLEQNNNRKVYTEIIPYTQFYMAENYHQKYYLQLIREIMSDFKTIYPDFKEFINSTAAAKINGYVKGLGKLELLIQDIDSFGLSEKAKIRLVEVVEGYRR